MLTSTPISSNHSSNKFHVHIARDSISANDKQAVNMGRSPRNQIISVARAENTAAQTLSLTRGGGNDY
jgi:hypothetical protein